MKVLIPTLVLLAGCTHSEPIGIDPTGSEQPFNGAEPIRLTYNSANDLRPRFSEDGQYLVYTFERGTSDRDRCLGVLPASGGQRIAEVCAREPGEASRPDGFELGALSSSGLLAYTRHTGTSGGPSATSRELVLGRVDSLDGAKRIINLIGYPTPGAQYDYLLDPVWTGPNELVALAAGAEVFKACLGCPWDTTFVGIEIVKFDLSGAVPQRTVIAEADSANSMAFDPTLSRIYFLVPRTGSLRDTVYSVSLTGGARSVALVEPSTPEGAVPGYLAGVAAGGGKLAISRWYSSPIVGQGWREFSEILLMGAGEEFTVLNRRESLAVTLPPGGSQGQGAWGRIAMSPDGRRLAAEGIGGPGDDLYLWNLP